MKSYFCENKILIFFVISKKKSYLRLVTLKNKVMKIINGVVYGLGIISIFLIIRIKLKVGGDYYPASFMTEEFASNLNTVMENLSYSYLAGLIMFVLTVTIPEYKRKNVYKTMIDHLVSSYYEKVLFSFYRFYYKKQDVVNIEEEECVKDYKKNKDQKSFTILVRIADVPDPNRDNLNLNSLLVSSNDFLSAIVIYEQYLSNNQLRILNEIRQNSFFAKTSDYSGLVKGDSTMENTFLEGFRKYSELVSELKKSL